jgi:spore germination protein KA
MGTFEIIKESNIRMPSAMGNSLSIVGSLVLGQAATQSGVFSPMTVIIVAITTISGLIVNSLTVINGIRFWRLVILFLATVFGAMGVLMGILIVTINMSSLKSFGKPFMFPLAPFYLEEQGNGVFLTDKKRFKKRTTITANKNMTKGEK